MKVRDVISLTHEKCVDDVAKDHLDIGEKKVRIALKNAGAFPRRGKRGWDFNGPEENLEKSIYDFVKSIRKRDVKVKKENREVKKQNKEVKEVLTDNQTVEVQRKRASFDIDKELLKTVKMKSVMEEKHVYEIVEDAIRSYLKKSS